MEYIVIFYRVILKIRIFFFLGPYTHRAFNKNIDSFLNQIDKVLFILCYQLSYLILSYVWEFMALCWKPNIEFLFFSSKLSE